MIGINDGYTIYLGGDKKQKSAYISVDMFRNSEFEDKAKFTEKVFQFFEDEFGIAKDDL